VRRIDPAPLGRVSPPPSLGPAPDLRWIPIAELVVDPRYQRDIGPKSLKHIRKIAEGFDWRLFSAVVVSPVAGGRFAIVDGQHRTTAAAAIGVDQVPCQIIHAEEGMQARAFAAINGNTIAVSTIQRYRAALHAGELEAVRIRDLSAAGHVRLLTGIPSKKNVKPGDTVAFGAVKRLCEAFADAEATFIFSCLRAAAKKPGDFLRQETITATHAAFLENKDWLGTPSVRRAFLSIDQEELFRSSREIAAREEGMTIRDVMQATIEETVSETLQEEEAA